MPNTTPPNTKKSRSKLQKGLPLFQQDIANIAREFTFFPNQYALLKEIHAHNEPLAESLLLFRKKLRLATEFVLS